MTQKTIQKKLTDAGIANSQLNSVADLSSHEFLRNELASISMTSVSIAALPIITASGTPEKVPDLNDNGARIRSEFK